MAQQVIEIKRYQGISYSEKEGPRSSFLFSRAADYRTDPTKIKINPRALKVSGNVVLDLILDADRQGTDTYLYGDTGKIYLRDTDEMWSVLSTVGDSQGNGMKYYGEDQFLYYSSNVTLGRYGPFGGTKTFNDDFLGAEGGVPTNTHSLVLNGTTQYATAADSSSLSITGDLSLEIYTKLDALPDTSESIVLVSKWDEQNNDRSYRLDIAGVSGQFGDGAEGALTVSVNTTQSPTDSACTGTAAAYSLSATNASFAAGQKILIHQSRGTGAGAWEENEIAGYTAGTITTANPLANTYVSGAQVIVFPEYTNVTVNSGITWTAKAWTGTVGGILLFKASGTVTVTGTITATSRGFRGGSSFTGVTGDQGEGTAGAGSASASANGNGGGGGEIEDGGQIWGSGGGGGNGTSGTTGTGHNGGFSGSGGGTSGSADLTTMTFGGGGGVGNSSGGAVTGGDGGGIVYFSGVTVTVSGAITSAGDNGTIGSFSSGVSGAGAGGSILIKAQTATLGTNLITAAGGTGPTSDYGSKGGNGGSGRIHLDYYTSYTGTTSPTLDATQDNSLVENTTYRLRLGISSTGTNEEFLFVNLASPPALDTWVRYAVSWDASASTAVFYENGASLGTFVGTLTSIDNNDTLLAIGASFDSGGAAENFLDGKVEDVRVFNDIRTASELLAFRDSEIAAGTANLQAYYQLDNGALDETSNNNDLTLVGSPSYSTDVPFSAPTSRRDLDQSNDDSGQTYALTTAIDEGATHRQSFVPTKDPQKSIEVNISAKGSTANWTITVHDGLNRTVATKTVANADLNTGDYEFVFDDVWRPVLGATYHFHLTSTNTTGTPAVVSGTASDLEDCDFHTYYQFLVEDENHPIHQIVNKLGIGNERYLATWDGVTYSPHALTFPSGVRVRCLGSWNEYLVIGCTYGDNITDYDKGILFFWDGIHTTYNFYKFVPQGGVNAIMSGDPLYFVAGYSGDLMTFAGGNPKKVRRLPKVAETDTVQINRNAIAMWKALVRIGMADSTSTSIEKGVYSWGTLHEELPETLSFDYPLSLGITQKTDLEIGMVFPLGSNLLISWKNGSAYGVDVVTPSNSPYDSARVEFLITDAEKIFAEKQTQTLRGYFKALESGDSVQLDYKIDREDNWHEGVTDNQQGYASTADQKEVRTTLPSPGNRFNEFQAAIELGTSNSTSPEFYGLGIEIEDLNAENRV